MDGQTNPFADYAPKRNPFLSGWSPPSWQPVDVSPAAAPNVDLGALQDSIRANSIPPGYMPPDVAQFMNPQNRLPPTWAMSSGAPRYMNRTGGVPDYYRSMYSSPTVSRLFHPQPAAPAPAPVDPYALMGTYNEPRG